MQLFVWGFCGPLYNVIDALQSQHRIETFSVSDGTKTDLDIHELFFRRIPQTTEDHHLRKKLTPHFETFKELYSRHWYPRHISDQQYQEYFYTYVDYFSALYKKHNFAGAVFSNIPHEGPDYVAFLIGQELGVKNLIFYQTIFDNRLMVSDKINLFNSQLLAQNRTKDLDLAEHEKVVEKAIREIGNWFYMSPTSNPSSEHFTLLQLMRNSRRCLRKDLGLILRLVAKDARYWLDYRKSVSHDFSVEDLEFVYFPLHLQPELTTSILGNGYTDQLKAIRYLSESLPENVKIVVKENPKQNSFKRPPGYLQEITRIPNVIFAPVNYSTLDLVKKCQAVATINGTVGWEAINLGKPVFYFGLCWYRDLPNAYPHTEISHYKEILSQKLNKEFISNNVSKFLYENTIEGTVDYDYCKMKSHFDYQKNASDLSAFISNLYRPPLTNSLQQLSE